MFRWVPLYYLGAWLSSLIIKYFIPTVKNFFPMILGGVMYNSSTIEWVGNVLAFFCEYFVNKFDLGECCIEDSSLPSHTFDPSFTRQPGKFKKRLDGIKSSQTSTGNLFLQRLLQIFLNDDTKIFLAFCFRWKKCLMLVILSWNALNSSCFCLFASYDILTIMFKF